MPSNRPDIRPQLGLRSIINVSGTMTSLGASIVVPEAVQMAEGILSEFVEINELHRRASTTIAQATGAEAGCITASCSAGITIAVAGCMTGADLARIEQLPDATGMKDEVLIQAGHMVYYGAPIEQALRLTGAKVVPIGQSTFARPYHLAGKINERTAAAVYVVSHHAVQYGQIDLAEFCAICRERGVPVIVDAASEYDLRGFLAKGADIVCYSAHKFLGGPTAGIVAGRKDLVRAAFLQNNGIGRGMKVGKESIAGTIAALEAWGKRDHAAVRARETRLSEAVDGPPGEGTGPEAQHRSGSHRQSARPAEAGSRRRGVRHHGLGARRRPGPRRAADHRARPRSRARSFLPRPLQSPSGRGRGRCQPDRRRRRGHPRQTFA